MTNAAPNVPPPEGEAQSGIQRLFASLPASYLRLDDKEAGGERVVRACRTRSLCSDLIVLDCSDLVAIGAKVALNIKPFGVQQGVIARVVDTGFFVVPRFETPEAKAAFSAKVVWLKRYMARQAENRRHDERVKVPQKVVTCRAEDGTPKMARLFDVSRAGAALLSDDRPQIGSAVRVGKVSGTVVRHLADGFALQFDASFSAMAEAMVLMVDP